MSNTYNSVKTIALTLFNNTPNHSLDDIKNSVSIAIQSLRSAGINDAVDEEKLIREIESLCSITIGASTVLEDKINHIVWLNNKKAEINWRFWNRYRTYLETQKYWAQSSIEKLDEITEDVLKRLEDPQREGPWETKGLVVGRVQSGKTANYIGLICKAIDSGYKVIIILSGMIDSLRSQTQLRIDEGVLGYDTKLSRSYQQQYQRIGVGKSDTGELLTIHSLTSSENNGDFKKSVAHRVTAMFGEAPFILVVKKNKSVLGNLIQWALSVRSDLDPITNQRVIRKVPLLIIDDEADNGSVNTRGIPIDDDGDPLPEYEVTAINRKIRELLKIFNKSAYVGYTATPFANIFIPYDANLESLGDDIFPKSFIINLPTPSNYIGPAEIFGLDPNSTSESNDYESLPIVAPPVSDYEDAFPPKHKKDHIPYELPQSLITAIHSFILVCAARLAGGQGAKHNSMLIHVTRYIDVQKHVESLVKAELNSIRKRLEFGDGNSSNKILNDLEKLWHEDFESTTQKLKEMKTSIHFEPLEVTWEQVKESLYAAASRVVVKLLNNTAKDVLDYMENEEHGLSVIAIGGDKLSRGLTLEGLSISYYLRTTKMYDTLMQMGRWFGYRPGYLNLCRLYTTKQLISWYKHDTFATEELLEEFNMMADRGETPMKFGLKVRTHPSDMRITAVSKMRSGKLRQFGYDGDIVELTYYPIDEKINEQNIRLTDQFLRTLPKPEHKGNFIWRNISGESVKEYIENFLTSPSSIKANSKNLSDYIKSQLSKGELTNWTVALISIEKSETSANIGGYTVGRPERKANLLGAGRMKAYQLNRRRLITPRHEYIDFTEEQIRKACQRDFMQTGKESREPTPNAVRETRDVKNGLLLLYPLILKTDEKPISALGFAISFPSSETAEKTEYVMNSVEAEKYDEEF